MLRSHSAAICWSDLTVPSFTPCVLPIPSVSTPAGHTYGSRRQDSALPINSSPRSLVLTWPAFITIAIIVATEQTIPAAPLFLLSFKFATGHSPHCLRYNLGRCRTFGVGFL